MDVPTGAVLTAEPDLRERLALALDFEALAELAADLDFGEGQALSVDLERDAWLVESATDPVPDSIDDPELNEALAEGLAALLLTLELIEAVTLIGELAPDVPRSLELADTDALAGD